MSPVFTTINLAVTNSAIETTISEKTKTRENKKTIDPKGNNVIKPYKRKEYSSDNKNLRYETRNMKAKVSKEIAMPIARNANKGMQHRITHGKI
jgi:hypothetical protein